MQRSPGPSPSSCSRPRAQARGPMTRCSRRSPPRANGSLPTFTASPPGAASRANVPGETQTLPLAIYSALQQPDGDAAAARLVALSVVAALAALALAQW